MTKGDKVYSVGSLFRGVPDIREGVIEQVRRGGSHLYVKHDHGPAYEFRSEQVFPVTCVAEALAALQSALFQHRDELLAEVTIVDARLASLGEVREKF